MENIYYLASKRSSDKKFIYNENNSCSFTKPGAANASISYVSDPAHPVPYRTLPIEATYGEGSRWRPWQVEDQRFVYNPAGCCKFYK